MFMKRPQQPKEEYGGPAADFRSKKKKRCPFILSGMDDVDYKDIETLSKFITERGKILPRRVTGVSASFQKRLNVAIKRARMMALLPFVAET